MMLADYGADVLKIEPPAGDRSRQLGGKADAFVEPSLMFSTYNRNKRLIRLDLRDPGSRSEALRLIEDADVVIQSSTPGALERLGLGSEELRAAFPTLIYASV